MTDDLDTRARAYAERMGERWEHMGPEARERARQTVAADNPANCLREAAEEVAQDHGLEVDHASFNAAAAFLAQPVSNALSGVSAPVVVDAIDDAMVERALQAYMATTTKPIKEALHAILTAALAGKAAP